MERVLTQFKSEDGHLLGSPFDLPVDITADKLQKICRALLKETSTEGAEGPLETPYLFFVKDDFEVTTTLRKAIQEAKLEDASGEKVIEIVFVPQAVFSVKAVTRCSSTLTGHTEAVVASSFSPNGIKLASGSGDTTVRFWDIHTQTPQFTCKGHRDWVLCLSWSPDSNKLASACKSGHIILWDPVSGKQIGNTLTGHKSFVTALCWKPFHRDSDCRLLASSSKDTTVKIWDTVLYRCILNISGHNQSVTCVKWGGSGLIYTCSQDRTVKVWRENDGVLCRSLDGHAHWVNTLALSTDYAMRTGPFDPTKSDRAETMENALNRYNAARGQQERLVSGSDDFTLFLWHPENEKKCLARMTGHQQLINDVKFSPDTRMIASASFDKSIKLWDGKTGKFITSLRGHVNCVYQISWAADSRLLVSGSADSTLKVWEMSTKKIMMDLPGHADQVYVVDWSPDGERVVSGGKDRCLKLWRR